MTARLEYHELNQCTAFTKLEWKIYYLLNEQFYFRALVRRKNGNEFKRFYHNQGHEALGIASSWFNEFTNLGDVYFTYLMNSVIMSCGKDLSSILFL